MTPNLVPGDFVFATSDDAGCIAKAMPLAWATLREAEGMSFILRPDAAQELWFDASEPFRCVTLEVFSSLEGVGLTAAVAQALAVQGIACNMVAGFHHDHAFVPAQRAQEAFELLQTLSQMAAN